MVEIVGPDDPGRDTEEKPRDHAEARIPEYWIVDPQAGAMTVLALEGDAYMTHGVFHRGERAVSKLLDGFGVSPESPPPDALTKR